MPDYSFTFDGPGIDTPQERRRIAGRPDLVFKVKPGRPGEVPPGVPAEIKHLSDIRPVAGDVRRLEEKKDQLPPAVSDLADFAWQSLTRLADFWNERVSLYFGSEEKLLESAGKVQKDYLGYSALLAEYRRTLDAVPWEAMLYPEEYPEFFSQVQRLNAMEEDLRVQEEAVRAGLRRMNVFYDLGQLYSRFQDAVEGLYDRWADWPEEGFELPAGLDEDAARALLEASLVRQEESRRALLAQQALLSLNRQDAALKRLAEAMDLRLLASPQVRIFLRDSQGNDLNYFLSEAISSAERDYRLALLDAHKIYSLIKDNLLQQFLVKRDQEVLRGVLSGQGAQAGGATEGVAAADWQG